MNTIPVSPFSTLPRPTNLVQAVASRWRSLTSPAPAVPSPRRLELDPGALHGVRQPLGRTVTCESGTLWLTFDNTRLDVVLEAGESHVCTVADRLLVQALESARLRLD